MAPLCQLLLLMAELPDMPDRVSALRLRPASCLLCGRQTVTCLEHTARTQAGRDTSSTCLMHGRHQPNKRIESALHLHAAAAAGQVHRPGLRPCSACGWAGALMLNSAQQTCRAWVARAHAPPGANVQPSLDCDDELHFKTCCCSSPTQPAALEAVLTCTALSCRGRRGFRAALASAMLISLASCCKGWGSQSDSITCMADTMLSAHRLLTRCHQMLQHDQIGIGEHSQKAAAAHDLWE